MKYKVGDVLTVIDRINGHKFEIGDRVTIVEIDGAEYYAQRVDDALGYFVWDEELSEDACLPTYRPEKYNFVLNRPPGYGKYLVVRKDGKTHFEVWNGTGWAYNEKVITHFYLPAIQ